MGRSSHNHPTICYCLIRELVRDLRCDLRQASPSYLAALRERLVQRGFKRAKKVHDRTIKRWLRCSGAYRPTRAVVKKTSFTGHAGRQAALREVVYCNTDLRMQDKSAKWNAVALRELAGVRCSRSIRTLVLNTPRFDGACRLARAPVHPPCRAANGVTTAPSAAWS